MADTVLLNATRSEAAMLLQEPPPRPSRQNDSVEGLAQFKASTDVIQAEGEARGTYEEVPAEGQPSEGGDGARAGKQHPPRLWAPSSRAAAGQAPAVQQAANGVPR